MFKPFKSALVALVLGSALILSACTSVQRTGDGRYAYDAATSTEGLAQIIATEQVAPQAIAEGRSLVIMRDGEPTLIIGGEQPHYPHAYVPHYGAHADDEYHEDAALSASRQYTLYGHGSSFDQEYPPLPPLDPLDLEEVDGDPRSKRQLQYDNARLAAELKRRRARDRKKH